MFSRFHAGIASVFFACSQAVASTSMPTACNEFSKVGEGELRKFFIKVYDAQLATRNGRYIGNRSLCLSIDYDISIKASQFVKETEKQFRHLKVDPKNITEWMPRVSSVMPSVSKGDNIVMYIDESGIASLYLNGDLSGDLGSSDLSSAFADIWLSTRSSEPKLRRALVTIKE